jgi:hypothetical protein
MKPTSLGFLSHRQHKLNELIDRDCVPSCRPDVRFVSKSASFQCGEDVARSTALRLHRHDGDDRDVAKTAGR